MHRWSTTTYDTIPTVFPDDYNVWQVEMPEVALQHPFLLDAIFALTTLELSGPPEDAAEDYTRAGFELKDRACQKMPVLSPSSTYEANTALLYFKPMLLLVMLASIQYYPPGVPIRDMLKQIASDLDILQRLNLHLKAHASSLTAHPLQQPSLATSELPVGPVDNATARAFKHLDELNKSRDGPPASAPFEVRFQATLHQSSCKKAIFWLEEAYTNLPPISASYEDARHLHDHGLGWINLVDVEFIGALRESDKVASLLLMVWAILIQTRGSRFWWARRLGTRMLAAISSTIGNTTSTAMRELLEWANAELLVVR
jgi:hypothetical protein